VVRTHPRRARRSCSSTPSPPTSPTSTRRPTCASGRTPIPGASLLLTTWSASPSFPSSRSAPLEAELDGDVGQPRDACTTR
jgi:hypothetical protein